jgi:hypothetical protein
VSDCTLASGEGLGSGGETSHPMSLKRPCPHPGNALYLPMHYPYVTPKNYRNKRYIHLHLHTKPNIMNNFEILVANTVTSITCISLMRKNFKANYKYRIMYRRLTKKWKH